MTLDAAGGHARLQVSDTGAGIDPAFLPHVFNRFSQEDSSITRATGGLGLGLAIVRHLVELHGGTVEARSAGVREGATFSVTLPLAKVRQPPVDDEGTVASGARPGHGKRRPGPSTAEGSARPGRRRRSRDARGRGRDARGDGGPGAGGRIGRGGDGRRRGAPAEGAPVRHRDAGRGRLHLHPQAEGPRTATAAARRPRSRSRRWPRRRTRSGPWRPAFRCTWPNQSTSPASPRPCSRWRNTSRRIDQGANPKRELGRGRRRRRRHRRLDRHAVRVRLEHARGRARHRRRRRDRAARRTARGACRARSSPSSIVRRDNLAYRYTLPPAWSKTTQTAARGQSAFRAAGRGDGPAARRADGLRRHHPARADSRAARPRARLAGGGSEVTRRASTLESLSTGSAAFDRILGGGLPVRSVNVIAGEPGAGKTLFALQMLFAPGAAGQEGPVPHDALRAVAEAHQLHAAVLVLRREPARRGPGRLRRPRLRDPAQGRGGAR